MKDLIERQDVLSICQETYWNGADDYYPISASGIAKKVKELPSAQPETNCSEIPNTSDLVSRKAVREMVATWSYDMAEWEDMELALHDVDELPPVSAERQRGKKNK
jgi:hypothetical protein